MSSRHTELNRFLKRSVLTCYSFSYYVIPFRIFIFVLNKTFIYDALSDLVPFLRFKKREKHAWSSVTFSKVTG